MTRLIVSAVAGLSVLPLILARDHRSPKPNPQTTQTTTSTLEIIPIGTIDGSQTPWLIPDSVAYSLFFETVAEPPEPTDDQVRRQRSRLIHAELDDADYQKVVSALSNFKLQRIALDLKYANSSDGDGYKAENSALLANTIQELRIGLSAKGMTGLDALIQYEKRNMKIAPVQ
jgi:hypothetical protein